jgi:serine/threonine protein kinase
MQLTDRTLPRLPQPIAAAWNRVAFGKDDSDKVRRLVVCYETILRTIVALLLADYVRGTPSPQVDSALRKLEKPTFGAWFGLLRELILHLGKRQDPQPFIPEVRNWFFTSADKPTPVAKTLERLVHTRNVVVHDDTDPTPEIDERNRAELRSAIVAVLSTLDWILGYRIFRVVTSEPTRQSTFNGKVQFFTGIADNAPEPGKWDVFLVPNSVYLTNPAGSELLELSPFLELMSERLYLIREIPGFRQIKRTTDGGPALTTSVSDENVPFETWLERRPIEHLHYHLKITNGVFRTNAAGSAVRRDNELGPEFEIITELGRGGMAVVYEAREKKTGRNYALKVLNRELAEESNYRQRFQREALNMRKVQNQAAASNCTVAMIDVGELASGQPYLKMPVMRKGSLNEQVRRPGGCAEEKVRAWAENALEALVHVHAARIVHRDIKPSNFLLNDEGRALLTDFGIAIGPGDERLTRTIEQMGTVAYMAPEQRTLRTVTEKADIYGLAVVLHELLTGELPEDQPGDGIESAFGELMRAMGEKSPAARPTAAEALETLRAISAPVAVAVAKPKSTRTGKRPPITTRTRKLQAAAKEEEERKAAQAAAALAAKQELEARERRNQIVLALVMLGTLFVLNYFETWAESAMRTHYRLGVDAEQHFAEAVQSFEGDLDFGQHDALGKPVAAVFALFYFFIFPVAAIAAMTIFLQKRDTRTLLLFATSAVVDYAIALPFYILFPLPERWAYPGSKAILLSDLIDSRLIEFFRPFSGLNNCFPSFHVSATVIVVICLYRTRAPFRASFAFAGTAVILATFVLGIHWLPDIFAGIASGIISVRIADRLVPRLARLAYSIAATAPGGGTPISARAL